MALEWVTVSAGTGDGANIAVDRIDIGGTAVDLPASSIVIGADGGPYTIVGSANPMPVTASALPLPTGAATLAEQQAQSTALAAIETAVELIDDGFAADTEALGSGVLLQGSHVSLGTRKSVTVNGSGELYVNIQNGLVTIGGDVGITGAALTALQLLDDAIYTSGTGTPSKGALILGTDGTNPRAFTVDANGHAQVDILSSALPSGAATEAKQDTLIGHVDGVESALADAVTALQIMDDWDETNRAAVNLVVGQAGITAGAGAVAANTPRVTLASNDPAVALLTTIDVDTGGIATATAAIQMAVEILDNAISGNEMQVDVVAALPAGDNNIGNVDVVTLPATPAGTNLIGKAAVSDDAKILYDGTTALTVKHANIDTATSGNNAIVAAVADKVIRVVSVALLAEGAVDIYWNDGTANLFGGTRKAKLDNTGAVGAGGFVLQENLRGWFKTAAVNRPINLNLSGAVGVCGCLSYVEADA